MTDEHETIVDPAGFFTIKNKPTLEELTKYYHEHYFSDDTLRPLNYQESYDEQEIDHINLTNDLCLYSLSKVRPKWKENPGSMLEVGVGEGFTMARAKQKGSGWTNLSECHFPGLGGSTPGTSFGAG